MPFDLENLGWNAAWSAAFTPHAEAGRVPARVCVAGRGLWRLRGAEGEWLAEPAGRLHRVAAATADWPVTGDWVACQPRAGGRATIQAVLPRASALRRKEAGARTAEQVLAANIDALFLVCGLDGDFNPRRLERSLALAWESGATPVVVLNKADLSPDPQAAAARMAASAPGVDVHVLTAREGSGLEALGRYLGRGRTVALIGSSGVGKSTLASRLLGRERQATRAVRASDSRGRHTTTGRELLALPSGGCLIDTPGLRELQLWTEGAGLEAAFAEVAALAARCRYRDCAHRGEPGCAVAAAVAEGALARDRLASLRKLEDEQEALAARRDERLAASRKAGEKSASRALKRLYKKGLRKVD